MSEPNKTDAAYEKAMGSVKEDFGYVTGSNELEAKDNTQKEGETKKTATQTKGLVEGVIDSISGTAKNTIGSVTGDTTQQTEGKAQQLKGDVQKSVNS